MGALNLTHHPSQSITGTTLCIFKKELKLTDAFIGHKISEKWTILDYILYRQGNEVEFKIISAGEDTSFVTEEGPLSDHPALFIEVSI